MNWCQCPEREGTSSFAAGVCLDCGCLNEIASLHYLTINDGANFKLVANGPYNHETAEWLAKSKRVMVGFMRSQLGELLKEQGK